MQPELPFKINHLQHIGVPVTNIVTSKSFYERLGFVNVMQAPFKINEEPGTCIMMQNDTVIIELYQLPASHLDEIKRRRNGHIDHIAFDVDDIDVAYIALQKGGFTLLEDAPVFLQFWKNGCRYFNISGPDGERLEFNQVL